MSSNADAGRDAVGMALVQAVSTEAPPQDLPHRVVRRYRQGQRRRRAAVAGGAAVLAVATGLGTATVVADRGGRGVDVAAPPTPTTTAPAATAARGPLEWEPRGEYLDDDVVAPLVALASEDGDPKDTRVLFAGPVAGVPTVVVAARLEQAGTEGLVAVVRIREVPDAGGEGAPGPGVVGYALRRDVAPAVALTAWDGAEVPDPGPVLVLGDADLMAAPLPGGPQVQMIAPGVAAVEVGFGDVADAEVAYSTPGGPAQATLGVLAGADDVPAPEGRSGPETDGAREIGGPDLEATGARAEIDGSTVRIGPLPLDDELCLQIAAPALGVAAGCGPVPGRMESLLVDSMTYRRDQQPRTTLLLVDDQVASLVVGEGAGAVRAEVRALDRPVDVAGRSTAVAVVRTPAGAAPALQLLDEDGVVLETVDPADW